MAHSDATFQPQVAELALLLLTIFWGSTFLVTKRLLVSTSPGIFLSIRFVLAALVMLLVWWMTRPGLRARAQPGIWRDGTRLGLALASGFLLQTIGLRYTTPARSGFLTGLTVLFVPLVAHFALGRHVGRMVWVGVALAIVGMAVMTRPFDGAVTPLMRVGDALTVGCAIAFAAHITWTSEWSIRYPLAPFLLVQFLVVIVCSLLVTAFEPLRMGPALPVTAVVVYTGVLMTAGAIYLQTWAQRRTQAVRAALIFSLEPVFAGLFAWGIGGDHIAAAEWIGGGVIIAGVLVGELTPRGTPASGAH